MAYWSRYCDGSPQIRKTIGKTVISYNDGFRPKYVVQINHPYVFNRTVITEKHRSFLNYHSITGGRYSSITGGLSSNAITLYTTTLYNKKPQNYSSVLK